MSRIEPLEPERAPDEVRAVFTDLRKTKWRIPAMYRTLGRHPEILRAHEAYFDAVMNKGRLDRKLKEKVAYKVARLNECEYSTASHYRYALKCGASEAEMNAVDEMRASGMSPQEAAALELAVAMSESGRRVTDDLFEKLRRCFNDAEIIELMAVVGLMAFASRLADALGLDPE